MDRPKAARLGLNVPQDAFVPDERSIFDWIETIFARGVRRPGYSADRWTENFCLERFRQLGLEQVRLEPVTLPYWEPLESVLIVRADDRELRIPCFALPHSAATDGLDAGLVPWRDETPDAVRGAIALVDVPLMRFPADFPVLLAGAVAGEADANWRRYDPDSTLTGVNQVLPFNSHFMAVMDAPLAAGALGFIGVLNDYPGNSHRYYVPYDGVARAIPGVWINGSDGGRLRQLCDAGHVQCTLVNRAIRHDIISYNVVGELPGADDDRVIVGPHHDGPWSSAVEDASGVALVLAQASYWSRLAPEERPHRLVFLLNAGHMAGGAGVHAFIDRHRTELTGVVLEVHLEHAANEIVERDGVLVASGHPEPRWWFTSRLAPLEAIVREAIVAEQLECSLLLPPDVFGPMPTSDGGPFHLAGVPLVNFLTAPFYLFDAMDTLDKIHRLSLVPLTRAAIRIIASTHGVSAAAMRESAAAPSPR
ncbi:MAG TPA: M28 family peptidase [Candidatus Binatus sp.]|uniref:M28 family peptidase n=1 Tax=Candidatus Binatus sp. TaxID=2811406 RepID=UPI002B4950F4|nr:M28 family peptidase [Candidatus Binatus sp.]HKN13830.1 M28 family peptidase [Candidatus Binatus sp.]